MKLTLISDTHNRHDDLVMPKSDIAIHSGDFTYSGTRDEVEKFIRWFDAVPSTYRVLIAGNHDFYCERERRKFQKLLESTTINYLYQETIKIEGLNIYGVPLQYDLPRWAFYGQKVGTPEKTWDLIPEDTDILITHVPSYQLGDQVNRLMRYETEYNVGDRHLRRRVESLKCKLHIFGHIHEGRGEYRYSNGITTAINASSLDEKYREIRQPVEIEV